MELIDGYSMSVTKYGTLLSSKYLRVHGTTEASMKPSVSALPHLHAYIPGILAASRWLRRGKNLASPRPPAEHNGRSSCSRPNGERIRLGGSAERGKKRTTGMFPFIDAPTMERLIAFLAKDIIPLGSGFGLTERVPFHVLLAVEVFVWKIHSTHVGDYDACKIGKHSKERGCQKQNEKPHDNIRALLQTIPR